MDQNQVTLPCRDLDASIAFYTLLGLVPIVKSPPGYARFECPDGGATLSVHREDDASAEAVIYFEVPDLDTRVAELRAAGLAFETEPVDQPWLWREASLRDPAGNLVCLYRAGGQRRFPPWRVDGAAAPHGAGFARLVLGLSAAAFAGIGVAFLLAPAAMAARIDLSLGSALADNDVRAVYGGLQLALGALLGWGATRPAWHRPMLAVQLATFAGLAGGRAVSWLAVGAPEPLGLVLHAGELAGLVAGVLALRRLG